MRAVDIREGLYKIGNKFVLYTREAGYRMKKKVTDGITWVANNPEKAATIMTAGTVLAGGISKASRSINRTVNNRRELKEKQTRIYDHSLNAYVYVKHPLSSEQIGFINSERRRTGKRVSEILNEMGLLRK